MSARTCVVAKMIALGVARDISPRLQKCPSRRRISRQPASVAGSAERVGQGRVSDSGNLSAPASRGFTGCRSSNDRMQNYKITGEVDRHSNERHSPGHIPPGHFLSFLQDVRHFPLFDVVRLRDLTAVSTHLCLTVTFRDWHYSYLAKLF